MKKKRLTNQHVTIDMNEARKAVKKAQRDNPEQNLSSLIRTFIRKYLSGEVKI